MADFGYFKTLIPLTEAQISDIVDSLQRAAPVAILVNPDPKAYIVLVSSEPHGLPYEIDLAVVNGDMTAPLGMTKAERDRLLPWADDLVKRTCTLWQERYKPH